MPFVGRPLPDRWGGYSESRGSRPTVQAAEPACELRWLGRLFLPGLADGQHWVSKQLGHESIRTTLKHYARFVQAVDERNLRLLNEFAAQTAEDVSDECHTEAPDSAQ
jgi:hypothetical protein